jgi:hypothetical protein
MADKEVTIEDDGLVTVDITDAPELAPSQDPVVEAPVATKPAKHTTTSKAPTAADEAAAALTQAVKTAETEAAKARAAEATALAERQQREAAQRLAAQREQEAKGYREQAEGHELTILSTGIENATKEIASYQAEMERAFEAGEFSKASAAQVKLSKASATLDRLEANKADFESGARKVKTVEGAVEAPPQTSVSAFEQYVSGYSPAAQSWLRAHPDCVPPSVTDRNGNSFYLGGDAVKNAKMMVGHHDAVKKGLREGSPEYFQNIEEHVGLRTPIASVVTPATPISAAADVIEAGDPAPKPAPRRQAQPSAPVSREPPASNGTQPQTRSVRLTPEQQEVALLATSPRDIQMPNGTTVRESDADFKKRAFGQYARELIAATAEGKIGRTTH